MNLIISILSPFLFEDFNDITNALDIPLSLMLIGHGTAKKHILDLLGIESNEKRIAFSVANDEKTKELIDAEKTRLYLGAPGRGIAFAVPIKSVGGGNTLAFLNQDNKIQKKTFDADFSHEVIVAITNIGRNDMVMDAARRAGATGGTVLHGKGTGTNLAKKFLNVSIASEKEVVLIVARKEEKSAIMSEIVKSAGPATEAGTVVFSLPATELCGFGKFGEPLPENAKTE